jgi:hypothetical protein
MFLVIELCLTAICLALAFIRPELGSAWFSRQEQRLSVFASRRTLAVISIGLLSMVLRLALLPILPIPQPGIHDEFSHLLLADTLANGRLENPTHPMWVHFETFHVNWHPTYASMYFPGQGLFLALGQVVFGHPFWGVWLSTGLMCAAVCWALQQWLPLGWALLGGFLVVLRIGTFSYWASGYWGGAIPALGGALVLGSVSGLKRTPGIRDASVFGAGAALLLITRPYESLFLLAPIAIALVIWQFRDSIHPLSAWLGKVLVPVGTLALLAACALGYYFWRVTGSPWITPYKVNMTTYGLVYFPWDKIRTVTYHHAAFEEFYRGGAVVGIYHFAHQHPFELLLAKSVTIWLFYFGPILSLPVLACLAIRGVTRLSWRPMFLLVICATTFLGSALTIHVGHPHYVAPLTTAFYSIVLLCMISARPWQWRNRPSGVFLVRMVPVICVLMFLVRTAAPLAGIPIRTSGIRTWCSLDLQNLRRAAVLKQLEDSPGQHVVIVRYRPDHDFINDEWVFNRADIDGSQVIWARDMGAQNTELVQYFRARKIWLLEPDYNPPRLSPYVE